MTACIDCDHWFGQKYNIPGKTEMLPDSGQCTRDPVWVGVRDRHFCSWFRDSYAYDRGRSKQDVSAGMNELSAYWETRAKEAERKLGKANARLRKAKGE